MEDLQTIKTYLEERIEHINTVDGICTDREAELQKVLLLVNQLIDAIVE